MLGRWLKLLSTVTLALALSPLAHAASVKAISGDADVLNTLGTPYIHSRHVGTMPYWGPCYRCKKQKVCSQVPYPDASSCPGPVSGWATGGGTYAPDAQWIYGTTNCRDANSNYTEYLETFYNNTTGATITGTAWYAMNDFGGVYVNGAEDCLYSDAGHTGDGAYPSTGGMASCSLTIPPGKNTIMIRITNGGGSSYGILQVDADINGTNQPIITTNPSTWMYVTGECPQQYVRVCKHYAPTDSECSTPPTSTTTNPSPDFWNCDWTGNADLSGTYQNACTNSYISNSQASWMFGASDGASGTAQSGYSVMQATFDNTLGDVTANLTFMADNVGWVWLNGTQVGYGNWETSSGNTSPVSENVTVPSGKNTIDFLVLNYPNLPYGSTSIKSDPALGILSLTASTGQVLTASGGAAWEEVENPPATPDPSMTSVLSGTGYTPQNCYDGGC